MSQTRRRRILHRDDYRCQNCGADDVLFEINHIVPLWAGGEDTDDNMETLCADPCHKDETAKQAAERAKTERIRAKEQGLPDHRRRYIKKVGGRVVRNPRRTEPDWL